LVHYSGNFFLRLPALTLVIGTTTSGKSAFAEKLVRQSGLAKTYIATAEPIDEETHAKIALRRDMRAGQGWRTVEAPLEAAGALAHLDADEAALLDCVTFWLWNHMQDGRDWHEELDLLCEVLVQLDAPVVLVSDAVPALMALDAPDGAAFQRALGHVNQRLASMADLVVQVTVGVPQVLKGRELADKALWD